MPAAYSDDLREKAMAAITRGEQPGQVARRFGISRNTLNRWRQRYAQTGAWAAKTGYPHGHSAKRVDREELRRFAEAQGGQTLEAMARVCGVGRMTDEPGVEEDRLPAQKKTYGYHERDETQRQCFLSPLRTLAPAHLIYLDEAGIEDNADYPWGWCAKGQRLFALKPGRRRQRVSMIAALRDRDLIAPLTFEGYCDRDVFTAWLEQVLVPHLNPFSLP